jgi:hypothetical protein
VTLIWIPHKMNLLFRKYWQIWFHAIRSSLAFQIWLFIKEFIQELNHSNAHNVKRNLRHLAICKTIWIDIPIPNHMLVISAIRNSTDLIYLKLTARKLIMSQNYVLNQSKKWVKTLFLSNHLLVRIVSTFFSQSFNINILYYCKNLIN